MRSASHDWGFPLAPRSTNLDAVERLFSMFPRSAPGVALLLLRVSVAATLWIDKPLASADTARQWIGLGLILLAISLCAGFLTPPLAVLCAILKSVGLLVAGQSLTLPTIAAILNASALALLGPGAYSIDASLFGRRVFVVSPGKHPHNS